MVFANLIFLYLFLPGVVLCYYLGKNRVYRNCVLVLFSLLFYAWGEPVWVFVLMFSVGVDYLCGRLIEKNRGTVMATVGLLCSLCVNLSLLGLFKYAGFLTESLNYMFLLSLPVPRFNLPIGISFYTFQALSYVIDVYRGTVPAQKSYGKLLMYVSLFPQLVAGPIVRYSQIAQEIDNRAVGVREFSGGLGRMIAGLSKKIIVANTAGGLLKNYADLPLSELSVSGAWFGMILFTIQIYYDFSGYSDMAIGLGQMFGFHFQENFNYPYISRSVTEFWRRWHISLSTFFRDYIYIPLGGNRRHTYLNLFIVWFLTGLWHGPSWNFVVWGLYFGVFIALERLFLGALLARLPRAISHLYLLLVTVVGWTLFYFTDFSHLLSYLSVMFGLSGAPMFESTFGFVIANHLFWLVLAGVFCAPLWPRLKAYLAARLSARGMAAYSLCYAASSALLLLLCTALLVGESFNPFLYFRF